jgi:hypothetical protein
MDIDSKNAIRVLNSIAASYTRIMKFTHQIRSQPMVKQATDRFEIRNFQTGNLLVEYIDAELANGNAINWWLEINWDGQQWGIESHVGINRNGGQGQEIIRYLQEKKPDSLEILIRDLESTTTELIENSVDINCLEKL